MSEELEWVYGIHSVRHLLRGAPGTVRSIQIQRGRDDRRLRELLERAEQLGVPCEYATRSRLDQLSGHGRHQGILAQRAVGAAIGEMDLAEMLAGLEEPPLVLILDGVQDPHNLGACMRIADAAGVHAVVAPKDRAAGLGPTVRKVACGGAETVPFVPVTNLARVLKRLRDAGVQVVGAAGEADGSLYDADLTGPLALVLGGEEKGLRRLTRESCDRLVGLPMLGTVESLNVSVAAGVCVYEALRQRRRS